MAVLDSPESASVAVAGVSESSSDLNFSLRRRRSEGNSVADVDSGRMIDPGSLSESETSRRNCEEHRRDKDKIETPGRSDIKFTYRPSVPAHRSLRESPLSSDAIFKQSHAGLFNLCIVVLVAVNSRLIIENIMKYGWLIKTGFWFSSKSLRDWPLLMCGLTLPILSLAAYLVEKLAYRKYISHSVVIFIHIIITSAAVLYPVSVILRKIEN